MSTLTRRERGADLARRFSMMDGVFEEWMRSLPMRRPFGLGWDWPGEELIRVDEFCDGSTEVIRAELPGIDPAKDVELTVADGILRIRAERRTDEKTEDKGYTRHEMRYGSLTRTLPLPEGVQESDISATYRDGILEVRVPFAEPQAKAEPKKIDIKS
ncbi:Hsp20/alpha crystallin family protein, partial [Pseudonocardia abyssalis]